MNAFGSLAANDSICFRFRTISSAHSAVVRFPTTEEPGAGLHENPQREGRITDPTVSGDGEPASLGYFGEPLLVWRKRTEMVVVGFNDQPRGFQGFWELPAEVAISEV
jgi:hypothetical protein